MTKPAPARLIGLALFLCAFYRWGSPAPAGSLKVEIRDGQSGQIVPAMVCITSMTDGTWRVPPDGSVSPPYSLIPDFYLPKPWKPGDIGPVRPTKVAYQNYRLRSFSYEGRSSYPFWHDPAAYFVSQPFTIQLPPGKWRLAVAKGVEYHPVFEVIELKPGETAVRKVTMRRWVDMARRGWYSGDDHIHHPRTRPEHDEFLMTWIRAEDLHVANILQQGDIQGKTSFEQGGFGSNFEYRQQDHILVSGQEDPSNAINEQGHALALNITSAVRDLKQYHLYDTVFDEVHRQGGVTGYAHIAWGPFFYRKTNPAAQPTWDTNISVIRGKVDFFEILQFRTLGLEDFYDFLNLGYKLSASAGSDVPWGGSPGEVRVYAYTGSNFSADSWFESLRKGHTFVTNGPMLEFTINGEGLGREVRVQPNQRLRIRARAWAPEAIGSPRILEVVAHGRVLRSAESNKPADSELKIEFDMRAEESQWLAVRAVSHNEAVAHSSPIYVRVNGAGFEDRRGLRTLVEKRLKVLDYIESRLANRRFSAAFAEHELKTLADRLSEARSLLSEKLN